MIAQNWIIEYYAARVSRAFTALSRSRQTHVVQRDNAMNIKFVKGLCCSLVLGHPPRVMQKTIRKRREVCEELITVLICVKAHKGRDWNVRPKHACCHVHPQPEPYKRLGDGVQFFKDHLLSQTSKTIPTCLSCQCAPFTWLSSRQINNS